MGFLKKAGKFVSKVGKIAAPVLAATGVGAPLAAGIMAGSTLLGKATDKGGLKKAKLFKDIVAPTALTAGAGVAGKALGGVGGIASKVKNPAVQKALGVAGKGIGKVAGSALKNPELVLGGISALQAAKSNKKAGQQRDRALDLALNDYNSRRPLQDAALKRLTAPRPERRDLTSTFRGY